MSYWRQVYWIAPVTGAETLLNDGTYLLLNGADGLFGFGSLKASFANARRPYRDGVVRLGRPYTPPREMGIALSGMYPSRALAMAGFRALRTLLNPYRVDGVPGSLKLIDSDNSVTRQIDCWPIAAPEVQVESPMGGVIVCTFWADDPFFYDPAEQSSSFALDSAGMTYPIVYPVVYLTGDVDTTRTIDNAGDVDTYPTITVVGPGQAPRIANDTSGKAIDLGGGQTRVVLSDGDSIVVDMDAATVTFHDIYTPLAGINYYPGVGVHYDSEYGVRYVGADGEGINVIGKLTDDSEFWPLVPGDNSVHVTMLAAYTGSVALTWYNRYLSGL